MADHASRSRRRDIYLPQLGGYSLADVHAVACYLFTEVLEPLCCGNAMVMLLFRAAHEAQPGPHVKRESHARWAVSVFLALSHTKGDLLCYYPRTSAVDSWGKLAFGRQTQAGVLSNIGQRDPSWVVGSLPESSRRPVQRTRSPQCSKLTRRTRRRRTVVVVVDVVVSGAEEE